MIMQFVLPTADEQTRIIVRAQRAHCAFYSSIKNQLVSCSSGKYLNGFNISVERVREITY